jgi:hypothetical protein
VTVLILLCDMTIQMTIRFPQVAVVAIATNNTDQIS